MLDGKRTYITETKKHSSYYDVKLTISNQTSNGLMLS